MSPTLTINCLLLPKADNIWPRDNDEAKEHIIESNQTSVNFKHVKWEENVAIENVKQWIKYCLPGFTQCWTEASLTRKLIEPIEGKWRRNSGASIIVWRLLDAAEILFTEKDTSQGCNIKDCGESSKAATNKHAKTI